MWAYTAGKCENVIKALKNKGSIFLNYAGFALRYAAALNTSSRGVLLY